MKIFFLYRLLYFGINLFLNVAQIIFIISESFFLSLKCFDLVDGILHCLFSYYILWFLSFTQRQCPFDFRTVCLEKIRLTTCSCWFWHSLIKCVQKLGSSLTFDRGVMWKQLSIIMLFLFIENTLLSLFLMLKHLSSWYEGTKSLRRLRLIVKVL